jgi:Gnt-I system high-affinity gluconate transporter
MALMITLIGMVLALVILTSILKINAFLSFLFVSISGGLILGIPFLGIIKSVQKGIGDMLGSIIMVIGLGAMLGKLVAESGAAQVIADTMIKIFGKKHIQWGLMVTGFIIGIPLFYNVGFVLCIPIIFTLVYQYKLPAVYIGLPMMASLSVAHGFLPPHPSPVALISFFHADLGKTLILGLILSVPALVLAGPVFAGTLKGIQPLTGISPFYVIPSKKEVLPGIFISFFSALLPVFLLVITSIFHEVFPTEGKFYKISEWASDPNILMLISLILASILLGQIKTQGIIPLMRIYERSIQDIAMILFIIGGSGALKQVLVDSGASNQIAGFFGHSSLNPLFLGWIIAATFRVCLGSATIAGLTTAGIILPMMTGFHVNPNLMVLAIGSGSLMFSHLNDPGFWMFKEYFHISLQDTFRSWSLMETIVSVVGLLGVLVLQFLV